MADDEKLQSEGQAQQTEDAPSSKPPGKDA